MYELSARTGVLGMYLDHIRYKVEVQFSSVQIGELLMAGGMRQLQSGASFAWRAESFPTDSFKSFMRANEVHLSQRKYAGLVDCAIQLRCTGKESRNDFTAPVPHASRESN